MATTYSKRKGGGSAVHRAAQALRSMAMSSADGTFLGSEDDMLVRLGVSRPTLRQASAQVLQENLIYIRRGVGGGYFSRQPDSLSVSRVASLVLQSRGARLEDIIHAMKPLRMEVALLAARNRDPELLAELQAFIDREQSDSADSDYRGFLRSEREFGRIISMLSGNSVLTLFLGMLYDFAAHVPRSEDVLLNRPDRVDAYRKLRAAMARTIIDGDEEVAVIATGRCSDLISEWMRDDLTGRGFSSAEMGMGQGGSDNEGQTE